MLLLALCLKKRMKTLLVAALLCLLLPCGCHAWLSPVSPLARRQSLSPPPASQPSSPQLLTTTTTTSRLNLAPNEVIQSTTTTSLLIAETEEWRQYVPLVVSCLVILDILLGSPAANSVLNIIRSQSTTDAEQDESVKESIQKSRPPKSFLQNLLPGPAEAKASSSTGNTRGGTTSNTTPTKERIDSNAFAQAAVEKAQATLELRNYLDARKTDWDRMEEIKRDMDQKLEELDEKQKKRQQREE